MDRVGEERPGTGEEEQARLAAELFDQYADSIYRYLRDLLRSTEDAEDLLHDTFIAAMKGLPGLRNPEAAGSYLFSTARRLAFRKRTKDRRLIVLDTVPEESDPSDPETLYIDREKLADLERALEGLTFEQREALLLSYKHELSYREIAEITGRSENAVKAVVFRAVRKLKEVLA